jgi:hypothetical protein
MIIYYKDIEIQKFWIISIVFQLCLTKLFFKVQSKNAIKTTKYSTIECEKKYNRIKQIKTKIRNKIRLIQKNK